MWSSTPIDGWSCMKSRGAIAAVAATCIALTAGCSRAAEAPTQNHSVASANTASANETVAAENVAAGSQNAVSAAGEETGSRVLGERDFTLRGAPACEIRFVYAGRQAENLFREEPCTAVSAQMMTQSELETLGKWERLDDPARRFVQALPGGRVLYVEGSFSASVYPIGTSGTTYEVAVAD